jgi:isopenicillin-N N-acyltransferase-like protein
MVQESNLKSFYIKVSSGLTFYYNKINFCTSFAAAGEATQGGKTLLGQTIDWNPGTPVDLVKIHHSDGLVQLIITIGNFVDYTLSSAGFGMCANATIGEDYSFNIPLGCYLPKVMRQKNLHNAMELLKQVARGIGYYHLADANGKLCGIESINNNFEIIYPERDMLFHSNYYLTERFKKGDMSSVFMPDSFSRLERIRSLANQNYGKINLEIAKEILTDHDNFPNSICHHVDETKQFPSETIASFIMIPEEGSMYISCGNPCESEYIKYTI